jgi:hypothetical protein
MLTSVRPVVVHSMHYSKHSPDPLSDGTRRTMQCNTYRGAGIECPRR